MKLLFVLMIFLSMQSVAQASDLDWGIDDDVSYQELVRETLEAVKAEVIDCGLLVVSPYSPGIPYPMVPAKAAIRNQWNYGNGYRLLAYYDHEHSWNGDVYVLKNPDGGYRHSLQVSGDTFKVVTPYHGTVAKIRDDGFLGYEYTCRNKAVADLDAFKICLQKEFVTLISVQLCRYSR